MAENGKDKVPFLEFLASGKPVIGDGSYVVTLEKRGYVTGGAYTPEAVIEYPEAVKQLHREFLRAGADSIQAFSFYATDGVLSHRHGKSYKAADINKAACEIGREMAEEGHAYFCGGVSPTPTFDWGKGDRAAVKNEFEKQISIFQEYKADFLLGEFFSHVTEAEIAIDAMKGKGMAIAITLRMGPTGDHDNIPPGEAAVRLARAGADIVGLNCSFDYETCLETMAMMKQGLDKAGLSPFLMLQPVGYMCPDVKHTKDGYHELPEFPFAMEPRQMTRYDARRFARRAYELGVHYIGGCCGMEPHLMREIAEELSEERGKRPPGQDKNKCFGEVYGNRKKTDTFGYFRERTNQDYWMNLIPGTGRPRSAADTWRKLN